MPSPPNNSVWEFHNYWNSSSRSWETDSSISVLPFKYPDVYMLEYSGDDVRVKEILEKNHLLGGYEKNKNLLENGVP